MTEKQKDRMHGIFRPPQRAVQAVAAPQERVQVRQSEAAVHTEVAVPPAKVRVRRQKVRVRRQKVRVHRTEVVGRQTKAGKETAIPAVAAGTAAAVHRTNGKGNKAMSILHATLLYLSDIFAE